MATWGADMGLKENSRETRCDKERWERKAVMVCPARQRKDIESNYKTQLVGTEMGSVDSPSEFTSSQNTQDLL